MEYLVIIAIILSAIIAYQWHENELLKRELEKQTALAIIDPLMEIGNRRLFNIQLEQAVAAAHRHGMPLSLAMIDIDHFKSINDTYGHPVGDQVLRHLADHLRDECRIEDALARVGGEEIAMILPNTDSGGAFVLMSRLCDTIAETPFPVQLSNGTSRTLHITVSIGIGHYQKGWSAHMLVSAADKNLYASKQSGRNKVVDLPFSRSA